MPSRKYLRRSPTFRFVERFEPEPKRVDEGIAMLGRMVAQAYRKKAALPADEVVDPSQDREECNDDVPQD